jgi:hypothetical protein
MELVVNEDHYEAKVLSRVIRCCSETLQVIQSNASWNMTLSEWTALSQVIVMI